MALGDPCFLACSCREAGIVLLAPRCPLLLLLLLLLVPPGPLNVSVSRSHILPMSALPLINVSQEGEQQGRYSSAAPSAFIHPIVLEGKIPDSDAQKTASAAHKRDETKMERIKEGEKGGGGE